MAKNNLSLVFIVLFISQGCKAANTKHIIKITDAFEESEDTRNLGKAQRADERINISFPGTKWCGPGNTASDYDDLGNDAEVDRCCRDHDHCDNIGSGETKYGLTNYDPFTVLHCDCDRRFQQCLHNIDSFTSNKVGKIYFVFRDRCYKEEHPIIGCELYDTRFFVKRCIRYSVDESQPREWQWFDLPLYSTQPALSDEAKILYIDDNSL